MRIWQQLGLLLLVAAALTAAAAWIILKFRQTPVERERRRRRDVNLSGRLGDATITDFQDDVVFYSYSVRGVAYTASQDLSGLKQFLPQDPDRLIGPALLKYTPRNPANSILVSEEWSGLRAFARPPTPHSVETSK
jgi:hypothetical protein